MRPTASSRSPPDTSAPSLCSCTDLKQPANYHWPTDTPENVDYGTLSDAVRLTEAVVRRLDERWLVRPLPQRTAFRCRGSGAR